MRVAINGFGRIGRQFFQAFLNKNPLGIKVVAINDVVDTETIAYLMKYDSVHRESRNFRVEVKNDFLVVNGKKFVIYNEKNPEQLPWKAEKVDLVIESSGIFRDKESASKHIKAGAKKVLISAPGKTPDITIVPGVNHDELKKEHQIISMASCTTNCLAPMVKVLNDNLKIEQGFMVTTHAYTSSQSVVDSPHKKDPRRGRAAAANIVPTTTGAAAAVTEVIPELKDKLDGYALRVPVLNGSIVNLVTDIKKQASVEKVNELFNQASKKPMKGIIQYTEEPIVSSDIIHNPYSCIFDSAFTKVIGNTINTVGWYDNEWGYSNRLIDMLGMIRKKL